MNAQPNDFFSATYRQARGRFLAAAERADALLEHHPFPGDRGPDGETLFLDVARIGPPDADVIVLSLSGTHGAEGFCGSAAQAAWLDRYGRNALPPGVAMLFVHAVNPFGFAHMVRNNENNVDLNRNFVDFACPLPENPLYDRFQQLLPTRAGFDEDLVAEWEDVYEAFWSQHGAWAASDAVTRGQYRHPTGVHFGGTERQWSAVTLAAIVGRHCAIARHVAYLDWHTLLHIGDGKLVFLCFNQTGDALFQRAGNWWTPEAIDREHVDRQWGDGVARSERRPSRYGLVMWGLQQALAPRTDLAGAVIEFCSDVDQLRGNLRAQIREHLYERWLVSTRDYGSPAGRLLCAWLRETNSPTRPSFQQAALERAMETYAAAVAGAGQWARENLPADPGSLVSGSSFT